MKHRKLYTVKEVCELTGYSRQRINQFIHGYNCKGSTIPPLLSETDYTYSKANIFLTVSGFAAVKQHLKKRSK